jgi:hypothetical protein
LLSNFKEIINRLEQQKDAIDQAIAALREVDDSEISETERPNTKAAKPVKKAAKKRAMSEEGRRRISEASRKRWALRANINETFLAAQIREQGEKEMNHDRGAEGCFGRAGFTGS